MRLRLWIYCVAAWSCGCEINNPVAPRGGEQAHVETPRPDDAPDVVTRTAGPVQGPGQLEPDDEDTAHIAPVKEDLARYTADLIEDGALMMELRTSRGTLRCKLFEEQAPATVANFVGLARGLKAWTHPNSAEPRVGQPFYDGLIFHRVIPLFMIQGGDPLGIGSGGPGYTIPDEFGAGLSHDRPGLLSMANRGRDTGGSQFFIMETPRQMLDGKHAIFGECVSVELIVEIARQPRNALDRPEVPTVIETIRFSRVSGR